MQAFGRNQISVQCSGVSVQVKKTQDLNPNTSSQETGTSFLRYGAALWVVFIICAIYCRFLGYLPNRENPLLP